MKIAIFHNFMDNIGGAEYTDLILARELKADIYTTNIDKEKIRKMGFSTKNIFSIGNIPLNAPLRQEAAYWKFRKLNLKNKYDLYIIAGDWAMSATRHNHPNVWYVYSPTREIWDLYEYTKDNLIPEHKKLLFSLWVKIRRKINKHDVKYVDKIISISKNVQRRVKKYLNRNSSVIYPPTETSNYRHKKHKNYWLSVNRLITHKRVDMQIKAFQNLPKEKLIIVGSYEKSKHFQKYAEYINKIKSNNVKIISWIDNKKLIKLYSECKGFITTSKDEDYGMTPLEAMASGKPVIAPDEGGYKETVINNKTGLLIENISAEKIILAVNEINKNPEKYKSSCLKQAKKFDTRIFINKFKEIIKKEIKDANNK